VREPREKAKELIKVTDWGIKIDFSDLVLGNCRIYESKWLPNSNTRCSNAGPENSSGRKIITEEGTIMILTEDKIAGVRHSEI
jgi:hypothetical protein